MTLHDQWIRKVRLLVTSDANAIDLSELHIKFNIRNADVESPNTAEIRVYNLSKQTVENIQAVEFNTVVLEAGYVNGNAGVIFKGTIKQFRIGKENATDTYLDILAADGDIWYNGGLVNSNVKKGRPNSEALQQLGTIDPTAPMDLSGLTASKQYTTNPRGQVFFGLARSKLRNLVSSLDATWSIQDGKVVVIDKKGYSPGDEVQINIATGLVGMPEQTADGIKLRCLLNSSLRIGGLIKLNNDDIIKMYWQDPDMAATLPGQYSGIQFISSLAKNGYYRAYVVEHEGDTRGTAWYSNLVCLAVDHTAPVNESVKGT